MSASQRLTLALGLGYLFFVVYGSLVPLNFRPLPLDQAWAVVRKIPMYQLGVASRADWIANGVLYVPLAFLCAQWATQDSSGVRRYAGMLVAGAFCLAVALAVEFAQIFFPPRTVSLNDLLAEGIGSVVGLLLAARYSAWFGRLLQTPRRPAGQLALLLETYLVAYLVFSLFPYDLLLSGAELAAKLRGGLWGWFVAADSHGVFVVAVKSLSEIVLTVPFGIFFAYRGGRRTSLKQALLAGAALGVVIEVAQFFIASGVSQGLSVLTRSAGAGAGLLLWNRRAGFERAISRDFCRYHALLLALYLCVLTQANGWFASRWHGIDFALARWAELRLLPFYYHYYTSEANALVSLAAVCLMYLPFGLLTWATRGSAGQAIYSALGAVLVVEASKLFIAVGHPDPTNALLGAGASWGAYHLARVLAVASAGTHSDTPTPAPAATEQPARPAAPTALPGAPAAPGAEPATRWRAYSLCWPALAFAGYRALTFPTQPLALCALLAVVGALIWRRPALLFAIVPMALPVLDLAPWSGRFYLDEFDLLLLVGLAVGYLRVPPVLHQTKRADRLLRYIGGLLALSLAVATLRGLSPWSLPDANAFTNYYSPYNALRIVKGALAALLFLGLKRRADAAAINVPRCLRQGMLAGLSLTLVVVFWERVAFSGLFNFSSDYRITGPFSAMHTGGAYIECFLAVAVPFVIVVLLEARSWLARIFAAALLLATTYALMVTFSRNGYLAFAVSVLVILFFASRRTERRQRRVWLAVALAGAVLSVAWPVFTGNFAQQRLATIDHDLQLRQAHWDDALDMRAPDLATHLFGMGLGRFPETHYLLSREKGHSATYQLLSEAGNSFLRLVPGSSIYVEQLVSISPNQEYLLRFDVRANRPDATLTMPICEKWLLTSYNCIWSTVKIGVQPGEWQHFELKISADRLRQSRGYAQRSVKLALYNGNSKAIVDVDNVRLENASGENLLHNGDFANELDHWFFSADSHLEWHAKSLPVALLFDQGWLGVLAFGLLALLAVNRAATRAWHANVDAGAVLAALSGFLVVGVFDTLIDAPRFLFLFIVLAGFCAQRELPSIRESVAR